MSKVICYPRCCVPEYYNDEYYYFEMFSIPEHKRSNVGHVGVQLIKKIENYANCRGLGFYNYCYGCSCCG